MLVSEKTLTIRATDLKVNYESSVPVELTTPGSLTVCCDKLHGILRSLADGEIEFEQRNPMALYDDPVA